jgi:hypothetical protein
MSIRIKPSRRGLLHKETGTPLDQDIPHAKIMKEARSSSSTERKQAAFANYEKGWEPGGNHARKTHHRVGS